MLIRRSLVGALVVTAELAGVAVAKAPRPVRCHAGYVRKMVRTRRAHGRVVYVQRCVKKAPAKSKPTGTPPMPTAPTPPALTPTSTFVNASLPQVNGTVTWFYVTGSVLYGNGMQLVGQPITYTITDATTGQQIGSFNGLSNGYSECTVAYTLNYPQDTVETLTGQAIAPYSACALSPITLPAADTPVFSGAFAGNSTYAPSTSAQEPF